MQNSLSIVTKIAIQSLEEKEIANTILAVEPVNSWRYGYDAKDSSRKLFSRDEDLFQPRNRYKKMLLRKQQHSRRGQPSEPHVPDHTLELRSKHFPSCDRKARFSNVTETLSLDIRSSVKLKRQLLQSPSITQHSPTQIRTKKIDAQIESAKQANTDGQSFKLPNIKRLDSITVSKQLEVSLLKSQSTPLKSSQGPYRIKGSVKALFTSKLSQEAAKGYMIYQQSTKDFYQQNSATSEEPPLMQKLGTTLTAESYCVMDSVTLRVVVGKNWQETMEIASLTKIMTAYLTILICKKYDVALQREKVRVSERAAEKPGTTAELQAGDVLTVEELLYGLMLPSGNDASVALAEAMGKILSKGGSKGNKSTFYDSFIHHMNLLSKELQLEQEWANSSGLSKNPNFSTPKAICILSALAVRDPVFEEIVKCKTYELEIRNQRYGLTRKQKWTNTNKLLDKGWKGVKTGTTGTAGHCLMAMRDQYLVSVFNCGSLSKRFSECTKIYDAFSRKL